jgi:dipeptidyl aminopeptidase/acylaminoacyl peptidase
MRLTRIAVTLALALTAGCAGSPPERQAVPPTPPAERLPLERFFANSDSEFGHRVSPDGRRLAWFASHAGRVTVFWRPVDGGEARIIDTHSSRRVFWFAWARDSRHVLYTQDRDGDENFHVYLADADAPGARPVDLTPIPGVRAWVHRVPRGDPDHVLITHNARDPAVFDLYRVNIRTRQAVLVAENPGDVASWLTDRGGRLRGRLRHLAADERAFEVWDAATSTWRRLFRLGLEDWFGDYDFKADGRSLWLASNRGRDRIALVRLDLDTGRETVVHEHPLVDLDRVIFSERTGPLMTLTYPGYPEMHVFDPALASELRAFQTPAPRGFVIGSLDEAERVLTLSTFTDKGWDYYLLDRASGRRQRLGRTGLLREADALATMRPVSFPSRDGLGLRGYLTLPPGGPRSGLPTVLLVHGGPWARDRWEFQDSVQFLANRGYAVLQVNYRGSAGYGRAFREAAIGEFAGKMHDDLIDGVRWAIAGGVADPRRVCIMGGSYGGYATLVGMTFTPDVFACGIALVGISSLVSFMETMPPYWKLGAAPLFVKYVGDPGRPDDRRQMDARSPLFRVADVQRPLLIVHGANDARVNRRESDQMVAALRAAGKDVDYLVFPDEGHAGYDWRNRLRIYARVEAFLASHLGQPRAR